MTDDRAIDKLANVCAMLTSSHEGERANAALLATRMLKELGLDWRACIRRAFRPIASAKLESPLDLYLRLLRWDGLNDWERGFVLSLYDRYPKPLTEKQQISLDKIVRKVPHDDR